MSRTSGPNPASSPNPGSPAAPVAPSPAGPGARPGATPTGTTAAPGHAHGRTTKESIQDTIISVIIAFALAFVFRGFVVEAFVIPTGSMAPTLMGAHERFRSSETGYTWQVQPWDIGSHGEQDYLPIQGLNRPLKVHDPMSGQLYPFPSKGGVPRLSGDRILVLKYLYSIFPPERFDVVVFKFKNPGESEVNYIKRLTGLPGEEIALVDGDVFFRKHVDKSGADRSGHGGSENRWTEAGWQVARKSAVVQRATWQKVFDSDYAPRSPVTSGQVRTTPWRSDQSGWQIGARVYEYSGAAATELVWDSSLFRFEERVGARQVLYRDPWEIDDRYPYDEMPLSEAGPNPRYPVSDIRMSVGIRPGSAGLKASATIAARGHEFQMELTERAVVLRMRPQTPKGETEAPWQEMARKELQTLRAGEVTNVAFCHIDQTLQAWINDKKVCAAEYNWTPLERMEFATGKSVTELMSEESAGLRNAFARNEIYRKPQIKWSFEGAPVQLYRVAVDRDIFYQPNLNRSGLPARGSRPEAPMVLNDDQFFVCGDNSPASLDARLWAAPEPFVKEIDPTEGIVPRKLMLGKAFFVYFPSLHSEARVPVPDIGRMRFIW